MENHFPREYEYSFNKEVEMSNFKGADGDPLKIQSYFITPSSNNNSQAEGDDELFAGQNNIEES